MSHESEHRVDDTGQAFHIDFDAGRIARKVVMARALTHAFHALEVGDVFEIRVTPYPTVDGMDSDFGREWLSREDMARRWGVAWYSSPNLGTKPVFMHDVDDGVWDAPTGCFIVARVVITDINCQTQDFA